LDIVDLMHTAGPRTGTSIFNIKLLGANAQTGEKLLFTLLFIAALWLVRQALYGLAHLLARRTDKDKARLRFWAGQGISITLAIVTIVVLLSVWFDNANRLATILGWVSAGIAFAMQRVITALAGYVVILRGKTFTVGDRITMDGVRGDVIALGFIQTTLMEMGEPPAVQDAPPPLWVRSRQYTGRIVTVTNDRIFDQPVYNYTRDFPYIWEEMSIPIPYKADRQRAEQILRECAARHSENVSTMSQEALCVMRERYNLYPGDLEPKVYYRLTDNWLELTVRFVISTVCATPKMP
jgi:small-conductance mechanosensitive channel